MKTQTFWGVIRSKQLEVEVDAQTLWRFRRYDRRIEQAILSPDARTGTDEWAECDLADLKRTRPDIHELVMKELA